MNVLKKLLVPLLSAIVGGAVVIGVVKFYPELILENPKSETNVTRSPYDAILKNQDSIKDQFNSMLEDDFFRKVNPFEEMKKMGEEMEESMRNFGLGPNHSNPFDSWFSDRFGGGNVDEIVKREDDEFVYYIIQIKDLNSASIETKVENGNITIAGTVERKNESDNSYNVFRSSFNRSFPLPPGIDETKMETVPEKDKIIVKFPKVDDI